MHNPNIHTSIIDLEHAISHTSDDNTITANYIDEEFYFQSNPKPSYLNQLIDTTKKFLSATENENNKKRVVLVTSGGTTVPLENNTVRFIDNFSAGTRGASSAEQFLFQGYRVIFLHREFSLTPFNRFFTHSTETTFLDYFTQGGTSINPQFQKKIIEQKKLYDTYKDNLLMLPFTTVNQYLWSLKALATLLNNKFCLFYLAAAVSDFYVPFNRLPKHKIQSQVENNYNNSLNNNSAINNDGKLILDLDPVPKFLRRLVESWASQAMIVSFKLETDSSILIKKAVQALKKYNHQLVIGNMLQTRNKEVVFVSENSNSNNNDNDINVEWIRINDSNKEVIEALIIPAVIEHHTQWIALQN
ncbi:phosphopantothenate--cysteine ligase CAB2 SCDLUD_002734 [Saccharomycodes ludwigii]|uniref:phosphopantothenate--cysteine ligase CAB2 n=1 Tax=Saccharomycodes ludwigii TaxID=36035 RepID=UPI001E860C6B|nr:hypothetical protein SCDLUD_002734 [Saccharomycodes ludwigii]KAH3901245.1 hypothetical protein SCDLUD_002734 [Saccharomycodes ludwigii]